MKRRFDLRHLPQPVPCIAKYQPGTLPSCSSTTPPPASSADGPQPPLEPVPSTSGAFKVPQQVARRRPSTLPAPISRNPVTPEIAHFLNKPLPVRKSFVCGQIKWDQVRLTYWLAKHSHLLEIEDLLQLEDIVKKRGTQGYCGLCHDVKPDPSDPTKAIATRRYPRPPPSPPRPVPPPSPPEPIPPP